jgi:hypothetical protein
MAEKNISEKLAESISKLIKKTNTFEKVETMLKGVSLFMFITGALTLYNSYKLHTIIESKSAKIIESKSANKNKMEDKINAKLDKIIETNEKIILLIDKNIQLPMPLSSDEINSCKSVDIIEKNVNENQIYDDDEILNDCYDNIPCNNSKKASGLNRLFGWK